MRLTRRTVRIAAAVEAARSRLIHRRRCAPVISGIAALALFAACRGDTLTAPTGRLTPTSPDLTLTGGVGTPIFPTVTLGEFQPTGMAIGLNNAAQVTGVGHIVSFLDDVKAFRWSTATGAQVITGCCDSMWGNDINDAGVVIGVAQTNSLEGGRGFVAAGSSTAPLSILPGASTEGSAGAVAINNAGQIVGASVAPGFSTHAVLWSPSLVIQDLGTLGGTNSEAIDINDAGQVIGSSQITGNAATHFFLWSGSGMQDLNTTVNTGITSVVEINAVGQITGTYTTGGQSHAFLYTPGSGLRDLGTLGGTTSAPTGLNDKGDVVGSSTLSDGSTHAFLWTAAEGMEDITALSGVPEVRRLNDNLQTLTGTAAPSSTGPDIQFLRPRLVQLQVTQSNAPPTALFNAECNGLTCVLDASVSLDDKPGLTYVWDLNKFPGGSATGAKVTVTYPHAGSRTVTLTVTDSHGLKNSISKTLAITAFPIAAFTTTCTGLTCIFDASPSTNNGAPIAERNWDFGDGATAFAYTFVTSHTFAQPGTYNVTLEILGNNFSTERAVITKQVTVTVPPQNLAPIAQFTIFCSNLACAFDASNSIDDHGIVSYAWDLNKFPNGSATGVSVTTTYPHSGLRNVTLTVKDAQGLTSSITKQFDPGAAVDAPPVARFTSSCNNLTCTFDASTSTDDKSITSYAWNLDRIPGGSATGVSATTTYPHSGTRNVTLTVKDSKGQTSSVTKAISVQ